MDHLIREPMARLETRLRELVRSEVEFIELIGEDLVAAGGKRVRPQMVFLVSRAVAGAHPQEVDFGAVIEMVHSASLLHDDLIDDAETRRGKEAAFRRYGNVVSIFAGDFLLSRQLSVLAQMPDPGAFVTLIAETSRRICEGEVLQFQVAALQTYSMEHYLEIITGKTAVLYAAAARGAAMLHGASQDVQDACETFALEYGRAFQIRDDLLDLIADEKTLGKPTGGDLREGKATLPILYLFDDGVTEAREIISRRAVQDGDVERMKHLALEPGPNGLSAIERAKLEIRRRAETAVNALQVLAPSPARKALEELALHEAERVA